MDFDRLAQLPFPFFRADTSDYVKYLDTQFAVTSFLRSRQSKGLSVASIRWYNSILSRFVRQYPILPQDPEDIEDWIISCQGGDELRHAYYRSVRTLYRFICKRAGGRLANPVEMVDAPRKSKKLPKYITLDQLKTLLLMDHPPQIKEMIIILADTGMRIGEALNITPENIYRGPDGCFIVITGKTGKRTVPIREETYDILSNVLPWQFHRDTFSHRISKAMHTAGINGSAHTLRHTFATFWDGSDHDLQAILGHSNPSTVQVYRHLRMSKLILQHKQYSPMQRLSENNENIGP